MIQPLEQRLQYHPSPQAKHPWSMRKVDRRLDAILQHVDVEGKSVLDLGCSGGFFSFRLSRLARSVLAIDADAEIIERNREMTHRYNYYNIDFQCAKITPALIRTLPDSDVTLFLSVFHHMLTISDAYGWNDRFTQQEAFESLSLIRAKTQVLVFEMGYPDEGFEWCQRLPAMLPTPRDWIIKNVFDPSFRTIQIIESPSYTGIWGGIRERVARLKTSTSIAAKITQHLFSIDPRDNRDIYLGNREKPIEQKFE